MDVPYFIKKPLWMSAFDEATLKFFFFLEVNSSQSWPWKQNGNLVVATGMVLEVANNWRRVLQYFEKKLDFEL